MASLGSCRIYFDGLSRIGSNVSAYRIKNGCCYLPKHISEVGLRYVSQGPVGFIGLGNMGHNMAKNVLKRGHRLVMYDVNPEAIAKISDQGALVASHPAEVAEKCDRIITMLPSSPHVLEVYSGANGILQTVKPRTLLIDSSTIDPSVSKDVAALAEKKGAAFMDAPVSGGVKAAREGILTFMVGAKQTEFEVARELLLCMGKNVIHCGGVRAGQKSKICNNMMAAIAMIGTSETMNLGIRLGLDPKALSNLLNVSSGRTWCNEVYNPVPEVMKDVPSNKKYEGGFSSSLMVKDLGLAQNAATRAASPTPLGSMAHQIYRLMVSNGYANKDFSSIFKFLQEQQDKY